MSSLRNAIPRRTHRERAQPQSRERYGLLEKHNDYVVRAKAFHKKEETLLRLKEKAAFRNSDEFYFKMIKTRTVGGVHQPESQANKYTQEERMMMKTQDIGFVLQKLQSEKKMNAPKIEKLSATLHSLDGRPSSRHIYYAEDRDETREIRSQFSGNKMVNAYEDIPDYIKKIIRVLCDKSVFVNFFAFVKLTSHIKRKIFSSYKELETRKDRANQLEKLYMDMLLQKELQKKGQKRKLREDEIVCPTSKPVYKWPSKRKR